jgi:hypothetical protein
VADAPLGGKMKRNRTRFWMLIIGALTYIFFCGAPAQSEMTPVFTAIDSDLTLGTGAEAGRASMILKAEKLDAAGMKSELGKPVDLNTPQPPAVTVEFETRELDRTDSIRRWILTANVKGLPLNVTQKRYFSFDFNGQNITLPYSLTNKTSAVFSWSIKPPPPEISLKGDEPIEVGIAVQGVPATSVRLLQATLIEQSRKVPLSGGFQLCAQQVGDCKNATVDLAPNSANRLWLRTTNTIALVGKYLGTVSIGAAEKPEGDSFNLTVYGTTVGRQVWGVIVIFAGVVCAWISTTWIQNRVNRAQLLLPAVALAGRVGDLERRLAKAPPRTDAADRVNTARALRELGEGLSEANLDAQNYLPPKIPNPLKGAAPAIEPYKQYLSRASDRVAMLDMVIDEGFEAVWAKFLPGGPSDAAQEAVTKASRALDTFATEPQIPATKELATKIRSILDEFAHDLAGGREFAERAELPNTRSFEQLTITIRDLSIATWVVFALLATALGAYVLVVSNLGFGVVGDFFTCLFWGFGLPIAGQQLAQSTIGTVATALAVPVPRPS